jgi:Mrp family chromosome partitioning ATPase
MSRNFDLLTEIESERQAGPAFDTTRVATNRPVTPMEFSTDETVDSATILQLVRRLFLVKWTENLHQILFCGVESENGSSSICASIGRVLASVSSKTVCLVDGNVHSARLSRIVGVEKAISLPRSFPSVREQCFRVGENLWLSGTHLTTEGRGSMPPVADLKQCFAELNRAFDYLLIDAPGVCDSSDAELLGQFAEAAILVVEANKTRRTAAAKAKESLDFAGIKLVGTILNNRTCPIPEKLYKLL